MRFLNKNRKKKHRRYPLKAKIESAPEVNNQYLHSAWATSALDVSRAGRHLSIRQDVADV